MDWTILRPHHFMQNLVTQTQYVISDGVVHSASGDGKIPYIGARDIATGAAVTLTEPGHHGKKYVITGARRFPTGRQRRSQGRSRILVRHFSFRLALTPD